MPTLYLKVGANLRDELYRLLWLASRLPVPQVELFAEQDGMEFLLLRELPGRSADYLGWQKEADRVVNILGEAIRALHRINSSDCPFDASIPQLLVKARHVVECGHIKPSEFSQAYRHLTPIQVMHHILCLLPLKTAAVFTHGDCCLPNIIITPDGQFGFVDVGMAGTSDPWRDLALISRSIRRNLGAQWVEKFFDCYGVEIDSHRMEFFAYLDQLVMARGPVDVFLFPENYTSPMRIPQC